VEPVRHVEFGEPFSPVLRGRIAAAAVQCGFAVRSGTYGVTQGPRLETAAEIERLARDGCAMVGMTALPEAALARELGVDYAVCAVAVNRAAGRSPDGASLLAEIERFSALGMRKARAVLERVVADGADAM
jgi:purine nucleoside phosphorylase